MTHYSALFLIFFFSQIHVIKSIRCGTMCPFVFLSFHFNISENVCPQYVERDNAQCSLVLELDFERHGGGGVLMIMDRTTVDSLSIETKLGINSNATTSVIKYTCSMSDNCAFEFARELFSSTSLEFDALAVRQNLSDLLYTDKPNPAGVQCVNNTCGLGSYCQGRLEETLSPQYTFMHINNRLPCVNASTIQNIIIIERTYSVLNTIKTNMTLSCNQPECSNNATIMLAYQLFNNEFNLSLNYSFMYTNTASSPYIDPSYQFIINIASIFLFHLFNKKWIDIILVSWSLPLYLEGEGEGENAYLTFRLYLYLFSALSHGWSPDCCLLLYLV
jgi:hypothetical protein